MNKIVVGDALNMNDLEYKKIKQKILDTDPARFWGDEFDVRFYLASKVRSIQDSKVLDLGGGIGIISSEIPESNFVINMDISYDDLTKAKMFQCIENLVSTMKSLPFKNSSFDYVICAHMLEVAKIIDLREKNTGLPTVKNVLREINRVLKNDGRMILTTCNNRYYKTDKLEYEELKDFLKNHFKEINLMFFNTYPRLGKKYRKLNLANIFPKIFEKILGKAKVMNLLIKQDGGKNISSVSFYVEAKKT